MFDFTVQKTIYVHDRIIYSAYMVQWFLEWRWWSLKDALASLKAPSWRGFVKIVLHKP